MGGEREEKDLPPNAAFLLPECTQTSHFAATRVIFATIFHGLRGKTSLLVFIVVSLQRGK